MVASPDFIADAKNLGIGVDPMSGTGLQELVGNILSTPADIVSAFKAAAAPPH
jgi:hypothetical protein